MNRRNLINLILTADLSQRLRSALEFGAAAGLLIVLAAYALSQFEKYVVHAQVSEAMVVTSTIRPDIVVYRAQTGDWPASADDLPNAQLANASGFREGRFVNRVELADGGALSVVFDNENAHEHLVDRRLTFRPQTRSFEPGAPVVWTCGTFNAVPGLSVFGDNLTDIAADDLPSRCRGN